MEFRQLRYFVAVGEEQHYGRAARRLRVAQPALTRQIKNLEDEIGFKLFERLPRGVRISEAGKVFLKESQRILEQVKNATVLAGRVAHGLSGTLRFGFAESASWHGVVPNSFRKFREKHPDVELELNALSSVAQIDAVRSGRLDAGYVYNFPQTEGTLNHIPITSHQVVLAAPRGHTLTKLKKLRLRDMVDTKFVWFLRRQGPAYYDRLMNACFRGGLKTPHIVQEVLDQATMLSLVSCKLGVAFVTEATRWRRPEGVVFLHVADLNVALSLSLIWRKDNDSPLLAKFLAEVSQLPEVALKENVKSSRRK